jgi:hypothetical protein
MKVSQSFTARGNKTICGGILALFEKNKKNISCNLQVEFGESHTERKCYCMFLSIITHAILSLAKFIWEKRCSYNIS